MFSAVLCIPCCLLAGLGERGVRRGAPATAARRPHVRLRARAADHRDSRGVHRHRQVMTSADRTELSYSSTPESIEVTCSEVDKRFKLSSVKEGQGGGGTGSAIGHSQSNGTTAVGFCLGGRLRYWASPFPCPPPHTLILTPPNGIDVHISLVVAGLPYTAFSCR